MAVDAVFRKLLTCALVASLASGASLSGGRDGDRGENTVGGHHQGGSSSPGGSSSSSSGSSSQLVTGPTLGSLYRSTRDEYGRYGNREQRCGSCGGGGGSGSGYADRDMRSYGRPLGVHGYYAGRGSIYDDRNWYYRPEGGYYDDRMSSRGGGDGYYSSMRPSYMGMMMGYDDRYMNRYDDRYYPMSTRGYYDNRPAYPTAGAGVDPYAMRGYPAAPAPAAGAYPGYRGNGYDNLDPQYDYYMMLAKGGGGGGAGGYGNRGGYYGTSGAYGGGYDDRNRVGYGYDHKNFRPWDETYSSAYSGRPRPSASLGATSYLMDRDTGNSAGGQQQPTTAELQAADNDNNNNNNGGDSDSKATAGHDSPQKSEP